jgi:hypothetical protein
MDDPRLMDVRWIQLSPGECRVAAKVADAGGERRETLDGERAERVLAAATPLVDALAAGAEGAVHSLVIDVGSGRVHAPGGASSPATHRPREFGALAPLVQAVARAIQNEVLPRTTLPPGLVLNADFWSTLYAEGQDGWELGRAAPPLVRWTAVHDPIVRGRRALVLGAGRGHDARLLARAGASVVGVDYAAQAVAEARALAAAEGTAVDFRERDVFALASEPERYQLVVEHTCFCAIEPGRRGDYARVVADVLEPGGIFVALFWLHGRPGGPPFTTSAEEIDTLFAADFEPIEREVPGDSVATRMGQELLVTYRRR